MLLPGNNRHSGNPEEISVNIILCLLVAAAAAGALRAEEAIVEVFLPAVSGMDVAFLNARATVSKIYSEIGVRVIWRTAAQRTNGCSKTPLHRKIVVAFATASPREVTEMALAYSNPYATEGPCVTLLMDRLRGLVRVNPQSSGFLLGHVLAHEMGHVLQEIARHAEAGVMKARWSTGEIREMPRNPLQILPFDAALILAGLRANTPIQTAAVKNPVAIEVGREAHSPDRP
jgi:hypothetical protein